ncbi:hypothetical protein GCM10017668_00860 [Streptomyces tuirus]|uniref:Uncharacterized protein n=1 Tax=Streptomyces tuirus TaxID=68278 RepID=A0A7G1N5C0_9ACTN|nr:hypothetical protein GCM10017668_00860 [Streptomyces tuirus]
MPQLAALALVGVTIAVLGALIPARSAVVVRKRRMGGAGGAGARRVPGSVRSAGSAAHRRASNGCWAQDERTLVEETGSRRTQQ